MPAEQKNIQTWLFNPFHYVAGAPALLTGVLCILVSAFIGSKINLQFDGVFDFLVLQPFPLGIHVVEGLVDWLAFSTLVFLGGKIVSPGRFRLLDVFGTQALARFPYLIVSVAGIGMVPAFIRFAQRAQATVSVADYATAICLYAFCLLTAVWAVALMYRAFSVSCNVKGGKAVAVFAAACVLGEGLSKVLIFVAKAHLFLAAAAPMAATPLHGAWLGKLGSGAGALRVQVVIQDDGAGRQVWSLDSLDQHAMGLPCGAVAFKGGTLSFQVPSVGGTWAGTLSRDGKTLSGTWDQGAPQPLVFEKEPQAIGR